MGRTACFAPPIMTMAISVPSKEIRSARMCRSASTVRCNTRLPGRARRSCRVTSTGRSISWSAAFMPRPMSVRTATTSIPSVWITRRPCWEHSRPSPMSMVTEIPRRCLRLIWRHRCTGTIRRISNSRASAFSAKSISTSPIACSSPVVCAIMTTAREYPRAPRWQIFLTPSAMVIRSHRPSSAATMPMTHCRGISSCRNARSASMRSPGARCSITRFHPTTRSMSPIRGATNRAASTHRFRPFSP